MTRLSLALAGMVFLIGGALAGDTVEIDGLKSKAPDTWKSGKADANKFEVNVFTLPKADGDPEDGLLRVFHMGKGGGGPKQGNLDRWKKMFKASAADQAKSEDIKVGDVPVTVLDIGGTYLHKSAPFDPNAKVEEKPNFRMVGVIFASPNGPYYFRLLGPAKTVEKHKAAFDDWMKNFR